MACRAAHCARCCCIIAGASAAGRWDGDCRGGGDGRGEGEVLLPLPVVLLPAPPWLSSLLPPTSGVPCSCASANLPRRDLPGLTGDDRTGRPYSGLLAISASSAMLLTRESYKVCSVRVRGDGAALRRVRAAAATHRLRCCAPPGSPMRPVRVTPDPAIC